MALQTGDLFVVNRGGTSYKLDYTALQTALAYTLPQSSGTVLGGIKVGANLAIAADGTLSANLPGALVYKGTIAPTAAAPAGPSSGHVYLTTAAGKLTDASWGTLQNTDVNAGDMLIYAGTAWDHVGSAGGAGGVSAVNVTTPITKTGPAGTPTIGVDAATATTTGVVQLADAAAIAAKTAGRVVDAAQLGAAAVAYASAAETKAGAITNKAVTPAGGKATYLPSDFTTLTALT